ncbi:MAG TPA: VLRF1 family aeRF1-type release factor [Solirubrobacterales bacterium]|nr:VLRF1 family aeRF1-type release factor [Solirubrobacterales bacterium]
MSQPTLEDARELCGWKPPLGVISVYVGFNPADRGGAWRTELRNGLEAVLEAGKDADHDRRVALRATAKRIAERYEDGDLRPPPRGEAGFVEVAEKSGGERWWGTAVAPASDACVEFGEAPVLTPLVELAGRGRARAVALLSSERVRLLRCAEGALEDLQNWELSITSLDWRERKAQSANNPTRAQGVSSSGHDQFEERLDHNRQRFLGECGALVARRLDEDGLDEVVVFGPGVDAEGFSAGFGSPSARLTPGGEADLISTPRGKLTEIVCGVIAGLDEKRERSFVDRVLDEARGGVRGAAGPQEVGEALAEGRVDHLVFDAGIGERAEPLVRGALAGGARVTVVRDGVGELLAGAEGAAAILRY